MPIDLTPIDELDQGDWTLFRPDGIAVPDCGYHSRDRVDDDIAYVDQGGRYDDPPRYFH